MMSRENDELLDVIESIRVNALLIEASEEFKTTEIKYPDSLKELWQVFPNTERTKEEEEHAVLVFRKLTTVLHKKVPSHFVSKSSQMAVVDKIEAALDFLTYDILVNDENNVLRPCPVSIQSEQALVHRMKKFLASKNNPVDYELNTILREAIIELEKAGKVKRDASMGGSTINRFTLFYLPGGSPDTLGTFANYERKQDTIPVYRTEIRGSDWNKTRMITPSDAQKLILQILDAFGGAVHIYSVQKAARKHIPEQMWSIVNESSMQSSGGDDNDNDKSILENMPDESQENSYIRDFYSKQAEEQIVIHTSENIWNRITEIEDNKLFCLYFIPKQFGNSKDKKRKLSDFGAPQTISDRNKKIDKIWKEEHKLIEGIKGFSRISGLQRKAVLEVFREIFKTLYGRCTGKGYNPGLSSSSGLGNLADLF